MVRYTSKAFYNRESEARNALKHYDSKKYTVRQHPKWKTWDVVKINKTKRSSAGTRIFGYRV